MCHVDDRWKDVRNKLSDLVEYSLDLIYGRDIRGNFLDVNDVALSVLRFSRNKIKDISFKDLLDNEQIQVAFILIKEFRDNGKQSSLNEYKIKIKGS